jgi:hypothetical protein
MRNELVEFLQGVYAGPEVVGRYLGRSTSWVVTETKRGRLPAHYTPAGRPIYLRREIDDALAASGPRHIGELCRNIQAAADAARAAKKGAGR